ncbi:hypothetical protein STEG23_015499 [Scotinomys teguina]
MEEEKGTLDHQSLLPAALRAYGTRSLCYLCMINMSSWSMLCKGPWCFDKLESECKYQCCVPLCAAPIDSAIYREDIISRCLGHHGHQSSTCGPASTLLSSTVSLFVLASQDPLSHSIFAVDLDFWQSHPPDCTLL